MYFFSFFFLSSSAFTILTLLFYGRFLMFFSILNTTEYKQEMKVFKTQMKILILKCFHRMLLAVTRHWILQAKVKIVQEKKITYILILNEKDH